MGATPAGAWINGRTRGRPWPGKPGGRTGEMMETAWERAVRERTVAFHELKAENEEGNAMGTTWDGLRPLLRR